MAKRVNKGATEDSFKIKTIRNVLSTATMAAMIGTMAMPHTVGADEIHADAIKNNSLVINGDAYQLDDTANYTKDRVLGGGGDTTPIYYKSFNGLWYDLNEVSNLDDLRNQELAIDSSIYSTWKFRRWFQEGNIIIYSDEEIVQQVLNSLDLGDLSDIRNDLILPSAMDGAAITWQSSDETIVSIDGNVIRPYLIGDAQVKLTAEVSKGAVSDSREFGITVKERLGTTGQVRFINYSNEDQDTYEFGSQFYVEVQDEDLQFFDKIIVSVTSDSDPVGINLTLTETGSQSGVFRSMSCNYIINPDSNPYGTAVRALVGDVITVSYKDHADEEGVYKLRTTTAEVTGLSSDGIVIDDSNLQFDEVNSSLGGILSFSKSIDDTVIDSVFGVTGYVIEFLDETGAVLWDTVVDADGEGPYIVEFESVYLYSNPNPTELWIYLRPYWSDDFSYKQGNLVRERIWGDPDSQFVQPEIEVNFLEITEYYGNEIPGDISVEVRDPNHKGESIRVHVASLSDPDGVYFELYEIDETYYGQIMIVRPSIYTLAMREFYGEPFLLASPGEMVTATYQYKDESGNWHSIKYSEIITPLLSNIPVGDIQFQDQDPRAGMLSGELTFSGLTETDVDGFNVIITNAAGEWVYHEELEIDESGIYELSIEEVGDVRGLQLTIVPFRVFDSGCGYVYNYGTETTQRIYDLADSNNEENQGN